MFKVNNNDTRTSLLTDISHLCVSVVDFELVMFVEADLVDTRPKLKVDIRCSYRVLVTV